MTAKFTALFYDLGVSIVRYERYVIVKRADGTRDRYFTDRETHGLSRPPAAQHVD